MKFKDERHKEAYETFIKLDNTRCDDVERKSLFYLLALNEGTRKNIGSLYDFDNHWIDLDGLRQPWQCSGSLAVSALAFNLYNGYTTRDEDCFLGDVSPLRIFSSVDREDCEYLFEAIRVGLGL